LLLTIHIVGTRLTHEYFGVDDSYTLTVSSLWYASPMDGLRQAILILIAWTHGCIGCHFWLRLKKFYPRVAPYFLALALLIPVCGLLGFVNAGRELSNLIARQPDWLENFLTAAKVPPRSERAVLYMIYDGVLITFGAAIAVALLALVVATEVEHGADSEQIEQVPIGCRHAVETSGAVEHASPYLAAQCRRVAAEVTEIGRHLEVDQTIVGQLAHPASVTAAASGANLDSMNSG
jgi:hypothetical protein